jgi:hypothetical protein
LDHVGVQYVGQEHPQHLIDTLETDYTLSKYWTGGLYCGITLKWYYEKQDVDLSMPGYIEDFVQQYQHPMPKSPQHSPYNCTVPAFRQRIQYAPQSPTAPPQDISHALGTFGTLLYNAHTVDATVIVPLINLASQLSTATSSICMPSHIYLSTSALTMNPQSDTVHLTCNSNFTVMPLTSPSQRLSNKL